jgi:hypothetical protein
MIHQAKPRKRGDLRVQLWNAWGLVDAESTRFPNNATTSRGPSPRTEVGRGAASTTSVEEVPTTSLIFHC